MRSLSRRCSVPFAMTCLALTCAWSVSGLLGPDVRADGKEGPKAEPEVALKALDPVLLVEGKEAKGKAEFSASSEGFRYLFVSTANKAKFEKDPERYAIQFRGHCAMMREARALPDLFTVYKGRIYAFGSEDCQESFREQPEKYAQPEKPVRRHRSVVILVFNRMELLDFAGPAEVFASAGYEVSTVAATRDPVPCAGLITLTPRYTFADCPSADIIVIPGGNVREVAKDKRVIDWLVRASPAAEATLSVCTGAFVLAKAGLLDGKEATTHWGSIGALRKQFPQITVRDDRRVVDNGKVVTSAGVSAGIDGALHLVDRLSGRSEASKAARYMEYNWQPPSENKK
jgi:putative intracellular protease/amidase/YHS domain-containing protein